jgi:hypothetical protein
MCFTDTPNAGDERAVRSTLIILQGDISFHSSFVGSSDLVDGGAGSLGGSDLSEVLVDGESSVSEVLSINTGKGSVSLLGLLLDTESVLLLGLVVGGMVLGLCHGVLTFEYIK